MNWRKRQIKRKTNKRKIKISVTTKEHMHPRVGDELVDLASELWSCSISANKQLGGKRPLTQTAPQVRCQFPACLAAAVEASLRPNGTHVVAAAISQVT